MLLNCGVGEDSWESLGLQGDPTSPFWRRSALGFLWKEWNSLAEIVSAKAETPVLWPPHGKSWLIGKDSDAGRDWGKEEKGTTEDEMAGWHHWLDGHEFEWTPGDGDGQGGLSCCDSWGCKESDMTEQLNWTYIDSFFNPGEINIIYVIWLRTKDFDCVDHDKLENSSRDANTRPPHMPPEKPACRSRCNS